ncbi:MAG: secretin N-terminal domain-containing protein [Candidatus Tyrphobacter sp.]
MRRTGGVFAVAVISAIVGAAALGAPARRRVVLTPSPVPVVVALHEVRASRAAAIIRGLYPGLRIRVDGSANTVVAIAPAHEADAIRTILQGIDVKDPTADSVDAQVLHAVAPAAVIARLRSVFRTARFFVAPNRTLVTVASPDDMAQIKTVLAAIDAPLQTPTPRPRYAPDAVRVTQGNIRQIARAVSHQVPGVVVAIAGSDIVVRGPPDDVEHANALVSQLDVPQRGSRYAQVYHLHYADAASVEALLQQAFPGARIASSTELNAVTVTATTQDQDRIAQALAQLDAVPPGAPGGTAGGASMDVVSLRAALPGTSGPSTSATDIAQTVQQALAQSAPDLHITVPPNSTQLVLTGSPYSIHFAETLIAKLDVMPPMVVLDTEILEVAEGVAKQIGFQFPSAMLSTTYSETTPVQSSGLIGRILGLQPLTRTPLSLVAELNFLISTNRARILEDPRITTFSGRTASIRAGETVNILVTTGGGAGVVPTSQVQSFQTGVTLDITPVVNADGLITILLHPTVNSEAGVSAAGVPNIQTRDTTTTVGLHDGQTLVIGGLIEDDTTRTIQKIPFLGDLPLIGRLFQDANVSHQRNELIVTVTPHLIHEESVAATPAPIVVNPLPTPAPWPTLGPPPVAQPLPTAVSTPQPISAPTAAPTPSAMPMAFAQTNVYTFGSAPANNYAPDAAPPQIFYAQAQPSVLGAGDRMTLSVITTTNVTRLTFGYGTLIPQAELTRISAGKWQRTFAFSTAGLPVGQSSVQMTLTATTAMGGSASVPIPVSVVQP